VPSPTLLEDKEGGLRSNELQNSGGDSYCSLCAIFEYFLKEVRFLSANLDQSGAQYQCSREKTRMTLNYPQPCHQEDLKLALRKSTPFSRRDDVGTQKTVPMTTRIFGGVTQGTASLSLRIEGATQETASCELEDSIVALKKPRPYRPEYTKISRMNRRHCLKKSRWWQSTSASLSSTK
jgi:hypothetical protein